MRANQKKLINDMLRGVFKRLHYPIEVMLVYVRWYVAYSLSLRHLEEMMAERGITVDHSTIHQWAIKMLPALPAVFAAEASARSARAGEWTKRI